MSSLMDELKKAGLASDKKHKQIEREKKQQQHQALKQTSKTKPASEITVHPADDANLLIQKQKRARLEAIYASIETSEWGGRRKFYFQTPDQKIGAMQISDLCGILLERGKLAIIQALDSPNDFLVVKRSTALALDEAEPGRIAYFQRKET